MAASGSNCAVSASVCRHKLYFFIVSVGISYFADTNYVSITILLEIYYGTVVAAAITIGITVLVVI